MTTEMAGSQWKELTVSECARLKMHLLCNIAEKEPVIVTRYEKPTLFLISTDHWQRVVGQAKASLIWSRPSHSEPAHFARDRSASLHQALAAVRRSEGSIRRGFQG